MRGDIFKLKKIMLESKRIYSFFKKKVCDEDEKMHLGQLNLRNFLRIQELKKMKNNSPKFLESNKMNLYSF